MLIPSERNTNIKPVDSYAEWSQGGTIKQKFRMIARQIAVAGLSLGKNIANSINWIRFPIYHHVFSDEVNGFKQQLSYLRKFGEFISLNDAVKMLEKKVVIDGRYFCLTFDDGFSCCQQYALPIICEFQIPAAFYVVSGLIGKVLEPENEVSRDVFGFRGRYTSLEFMSWPECREAIAAGVTIGSHTKTHVRLSKITTKDIYTELLKSKIEIEQFTDRSCEHFCAPCGIPGEDFDLKRDSQIAKGIGYRSFATSSRGINQRGDNPFSLRRDHLIANWSKHQLRYFLSIPDS